MRKQRVRGLFVSGTDTGVGKTVVAGALAAWCRMRGLDVGIMKPVATGGGPCRSGRLVSRDAVLLAAAAGQHDAWSLVNPVCFAEPLAPLIAAERAGRRVNLARVLSAYRRLLTRHNGVIVEGIGGLLVPLTARDTVLTLVKRMGLPLLLVARPALGTLNHTLLSLETARRAKVPLAGIIVNAAGRPSQNAAGRLAERTNPDALRRLSGVTVFGPLPYAPRIGQAGAARQAAWLEQALGRAALRRLFHLE